MGPVFPLTDFSVIRAVQDPLPSASVHSPLSGLSETFTCEGPPRWALRAAAEYFPCGPCASLWWLGNPVAQSPRPSRDGRQGSQDGAGSRAKGGKHRAPAGHRPHSGPSTHRPHTHVPVRSPAPAVALARGEGQRPPFAPGDLSVCPAGSCRPWRSCVLRKPGFTRGRGQLAISTPGWGSSP